MTNTINVPRELLENIVLCYNEGEFELGTLAAECHALLSAPSSANHVEDVRAMVDAPAAPAADALLVEALDYQVLFDAIAAATSVYANGAIISVQAFRDALAAHRAKGAV